MFLVDMEWWMNMVRPTGYLLVVAVVLAIWHPGTAWPSADDEVRRLELKLQELRKRFTDRHPDVVWIKKDLAEARKRHRLQQQRLEAFTSKQERRQKDMPRPAVKQKNNSAHLPAESTERATAAPERMPGSKEPGNVGFVHPGGLHPVRQLERVRRMIAAGKQPETRAFENIRTIAVNWLSKPSAPTGNLHVPGYYSGPDIFLAATKGLRTDARTAFTCALVYQLSQTELSSQCAQKTVQILVDWANTNRSISGDDGTLVMTYTGLGLVFAAELVWDFTGWTEVKRTAFEGWLSRIFLPAAEVQSRSENNTGSWGALGLITAHHLLDDKEAVLRDVAMIRRKIDLNIAADGRMPAEVNRTGKELWYTYFALAPLTAAAEVAYNAIGVDLYRFRGQDGAGLREALDYLFRSAMAPSRSPFERKYKIPDLFEPWPQNLFEAMSAVYQDREYEEKVREFRPTQNLDHHFAWAAPTLLRPVRP